MLIPLVLRKIQTKNGLLGLTQQKNGDSIKWFWGHSPLLTGSSGRADRLGVYLEQKSVSPSIASNPSGGLWLRSGGPWEKDSVA